MGFVDNKLVFNKQNYFEITANPQIKIFHKNNLTLTNENEFSINSKIIKHEKLNIEQIEIEVRTFAEDDNLEVLKSEKKAKNKRTKSKRKKNIIPIIIDEEDQAPEVIHESSDEEKIKETFKHSQKKKRNTKKKNK